MMKTIKRWTTTITASFDRLISQVENHDALVESALREVRESSARARSQLRRVKRDGELMQKKLAELHKADEQWKDRARRIVTMDEEKALECVKRQRRIAREIAELEEQTEQHAKIEKQLSEDIGTIENRLRQLTQQRNLLRTRQSRAEALKALQFDECLHFSEVDELFERWESRVSEYEFEGGNYQDADDVAEEFATEEEQAELREALAQILEQASVEKNI